MNITLSAHRPFHFAQLANALSPYATPVRLYTSAPRKFFRGLDPSIDLRFTPSPILIASLAFPRLIHSALLDLDTVLYDQTVASLLPPTDLFFALATRALRSAKAVQRRGGRFILDRACPHVLFQQALLQRESERVGFRFRPQPQWLVDRQLEEYALADAILVPSLYTQATFPEKIQSRLILAPLLGRIANSTAPRERPNPVFTVGVLGNSPLRKGYLYLLEAWKQLALPNARLLIRCAGGFNEYPALRQLMRDCPNVQLLPYIADLNAFYHSLDAFVLPSVDDGFGMALFEALSAAVPSIATTACGASELLTNEADSLIVSPRDPVSLAAALLRLYESGEFRHTLGAAGAATAARIQASQLYESSVANLLARLR